MGIFSLLAVVVVGMFSAISAISVEAAPLRVSSFFGKTGSGDGEFSNTTGVGGLAVNRTGVGGAEPGSVYVVDRGGSRVERFAPNPLTGAYEYKSQFGSSGTNEGGKFTTPQAVAVDPSDGSVYVLDAGNFRLQKFSAAGVFQWAAGQNVLTGSPATGYALCTVPASCKVGTVGTQGGTFGTFAAAAGGGVAVEPGTGNIYVTDPGNSRVQEFSSNGSFLRAFGWNVVSFGPGNAGTAEVQTVKVPSDGGTFSLTFNSQTTGGSATGTLTATSKEVTALSTTAGFVVGEVISGEGIPAGTAVTAVGASTLNISNAATISKAGVALSANLSATTTATQVEAALNALSSIGGGAAHGRVTVSGGPGDASGSHPYEVTFGGSLLGENVTPIAASSASLSSPLGSELQCAGGPAAATLAYQWFHNGQVIPGATASTYTTSQANGDKEKAIQCRVTATRAEGATAKVSTGAPIVVSPYPAITPPTPGTPTISGTAEAGKKLTCAPGSWAGASNFSFQWLRNGASLGSANGAQTNEYEVQSADLGTSLQCEVTGSNLAAGGGAAVADSAGTLPLAVTPANTGLPATAPTVTDTTQTATPPVAGDVLSCANGTWAGATSFKYQWLSGGSPATGSGAQTNSYTVAAADAAKAIQCMVTAENAQGKASAVSANLVAQTPPSPLPPVRPTAAISVTGTRIVGNTLTCAHGTWTNATGAQYTYTWLRNGAAIAGSTSAPTTGNDTYVLVAEDAGSQIQCQVVATTATSDSSAAISPTAAAISPLISAATATLSGAPSITIATTVNGAPAFEVCTLAEGCQKAATGSGTGQFAASQPTRLAVDSSGNVYTVQNANPFRVQRFTPAGASLTPEAFGPAELEGTTASGNNANAPIDIAFDPASGNLLVAKAFPKAATPICPTGLESVAAERRVLEVSPLASVLQTGLTCSWTTTGAVNGITTLNGIAAGVGGAVLVSSSTPEQRVYVLNQAGATPPPAVTIESATAVGTHGATLNASVTALCPTPLATGYHFEYRKDEEGAPWVDTPASDVSLAATGPISEAIASGLEANQAYVFRLVLNCQYGSASVISAEGSFTTGTLPIEEAATLEPWPIGDTFATLRGELNPNNTAAEWRFQYVDDATFQADQPNGFEHAQETAVETATGGVVREVSLEVGELEPSTTYHYRLVAENGFGPKAEAPERTFSTFREPAADLQGPRAYELVSSADKRGADVITSPLITESHSGVGVQALVAPGGGAITWEDLAVSPNPEPTNGHQNVYRSNREPMSGWGVTALAPSTAGGSEYFVLRASSSDLSSAVLERNPTGAQSAAGELLYRDTTGNVDLIGAGIGQPGPKERVQLSPDGKRVYLETLSRLLPEDTTESNAKQLYSWAPEDGMELAGINSAGDVTSPCGASLAGANHGISVPDISEDGNRVFFNSPQYKLQSPGSACSFGGSAATSAIYVSDLYVRDVDTGETINLSRPPGSNPDVGSTGSGQLFGAAFVGPAAHGGAYFLSGSKLTSDDPNEGSGASGVDLFRYDPGRVVNEVQELNVKGGSGGFAVTVPAASGYASTNSSTVISNVRTASGAFHVGDQISGTGIQAGTTITAIDPTTGELTISPAATSSGNNRRIVASDTTDTLAFDVAASGGVGATASLQNAVNELPAIKAGGGSVSVTASGDPTDPSGVTYTITFDDGQLADTAQPLLGATGSGDVVAAIEASTVGGPVTRLSVAQAGGEENANVGIGPFVDVAAISSADGSHVYFLAKGQLIPGRGKNSSENSSQKSANLYLWSEGQGLKYVTTIASGTQNGNTTRNGVDSSPLELKVAAVTPDGSDLVFNTTSKLTGYNNQGFGEIYRYDAPSGEISCVSCNPTGAPQNGGRSPYLGSMFTEGAEIGSAEAAHINGLSDDGTTVFFASTDQLLPTASNLASDSAGTPIYNIYAWQSGLLSLVSSGTSPSSDFLIGASSSGREIYFATSLQILPRDGDQAYDIYSYTTEGGFPEEALPLQPCDPLALAGEGCQGAPSQAPPGSPTSSATFSGPGSAKPTAKKPRRCPKGRRRVRNKKDGEVRCLGKRHNKHSRHGKRGRGQTRQAQTISRGNVR